MSGIVFFKTRNLDQIIKFYLDRLECHLWLDQGSCKIVRHGNMILGFHEQPDLDTEGLITFVYSNRQGVDSIYERVKDIASNPPVLNPKFDIYHFFATDPEGRYLEFQCFNHPISHYQTGYELLVSRRSVRKFLKMPVSNEILDELMDLFRWSPSSRNSQPCYVRFIQDRAILDWLAGLRDTASEPIGKAPLAAVIISDPSLSRRHIQDGCIAAYHLMLSAHYLGLGACWIAAMDRPDIKEKLTIPVDHYISTITPLGWPDSEEIQRSDRKPAHWFLRD